MVDSNKNAQDDEYQFPQDEYTSPDETKVETQGEGHTDAEQPVSSSSKSIFSVVQGLLGGRNKRITIVVGIIIVLFIIVHFANKPKPTPVKTVPQPTPVSVAPTNDNQMVGSLDSLKSYTERTESQMQNLQSQLSSIQADLAQTQSQNQSLQQTVSALSQEVQAIAARLNALATQPVPSKKRIVYHLRAVLPDRAWITSNTGETKTVTLGDDIKGYGTVQQIDSQRGMIITSSGRKIVYGPNDY